MQMTTELWAAITDGAPPLVERVVSDIIETGDLAVFDTADPDTLRESYARWLGMDDHASEGGQAEGHNCFMLLDTVLQQVDWPDVLARIERYKALAAAQPAPQPPYEDNLSGPVLPMSVEQWARIKTLLDQSHGWEWYRCNDRMQAVDKVYGYWLHYNPPEGGCTLRCFNDPEQLIRFLNGYKKFTDALGEE